MKKLFAFVAAAFVSVAMFASREVVPSDADLASYATKTYTMCIYNGDACNGIVLNGTYSGWSGDPNHAKLLDFQPVIGFDGWYVVSWNDTTGAETKDGGVQARPIQLDGSGLFNWDYQIGGDAELIRGTADLIPYYYYNEVDIKNLQPGIVVIDVKSWKNNPCTAVYHVYNITLVSPDCNDEDFITPAISGGFNGWAQEAMTINMLKTAERQNAGLPGAVFEYSVKAAKGTEFKFRSSEEWGKDWTNQLKEYNAEDDEWKAFNNGQNLVLGKETNIVYDLGDPEMYSWDNCVRPEDSVEYKVTVNVTVPAGAPVAGVEIIGTFDDWNGVVMTKKAEGYYTATINAVSSNVFNFREAGTWDNQIMVWVPANDENPEGKWQEMDAIKFGNVWYDTYYNGKKIELDFSDSAKYAWKVKQYNLTLLCDKTKGYVSQIGKYPQFTITATPKYGYHFTQWSDGNTDNPRIVVLTQDTTITAEFAANIYSISTASYNPEWGTTAGDTSALYGDQVQISAVANYGYHFERWNDGYSSNPRTITVTQNETYIATFAKNTYYITKIADETKGSISGPSQAKYLDEVTLIAVPKYGYNFAHWNDGNTDNPRHIQITKDITVSAEFAVSRSGECGDNLALTWYYNETEKQLIITGKGALNSNYTFGLEAPTQVENLIIQEGVTSVGDGAFNGMCSLITSLALPTTVTAIGDSAFFGLNSRKFNKLTLPTYLISIGDHAFEGAAYLQNIHFGSALEEIGAYAFYGCTRVKEMTCLAEITPNVGTNALSSINSLATLYVPSDYLFDYQIDPNWSRFALKAIGATETTVPDNTVIITPETSEVTLTWPVNASAETYTIEITKDGVIVCKLVFSANGQLIGIAFAPGRKNNHPQAPSAKLTENGMQFTVTGLNSGTDYEYRVIAKNANEEVVASYTGEFTTAGSIATGIDQITNDQSPITTKVLRNGQIFILRGDKTYTITGQEVQ